MALALLLFGFAFVAIGVRNTQSQISGLLASDFSGAGSFWYFIAGIAAAGALGFYTPLRGASRGLILLLIVVLILSNEGFFAQLQLALKNPTPSTAPAPPAAPTASVIGSAASAVNQALGGPANSALNNPQLTAPVPDVTNIVPGL